MLNDPSYISQGTLGVRRNNNGSQDSIVAALYHLNMSREKEKFIYKKEQETTVKERFIIERTVRINTAIRMYEWSVYHTNFLHSQGDIQAHVLFVRCI